MEFVDRVIEQKKRLIRKPPCSGVGFLNPEENGSAPKILVSPVDQPSRRAKSLQLRVRSLRTWYCGVEELWWDMQNLVPEFAQSTIGCGMYVSRTVGHAIRKTLGAGSMSAASGIPSQVLTFGISSTEFTPDPISVFESHTDF